MENSANGISLKIPIEFCFSTTEVEFDIINESKNKDDLIQKLLTEKKDIKSQLNTIQIQQREMQIQQREMQIEQKEMKEKINLILEKLEKIINGDNFKNKDENKIEEKNDDKNDEDFENVLKLSKIVDKNNNQINHIKNWISPNKKIKCKLLYDGKRDGGQTSIFHSFCDNKGPTITFIKTDDNRRIGGYTMKNWENDVNGKWISDDKAFIFDLDLNEKYDVNQPGSAIYCYKIYGPTFGGHHNIYLGENFCSDKNNSYYYHANNNYYKYSSNIKNKTQTHFICKEIEVYQIIFDS